MSPIKRLQTLFQAVSATFKSSNTAEKPKTPTEERAERGLPELSHHRPNFLRGR